MPKPDSSIEVSKLAQAVEPEVPVAAVPQPPMRRMFRALRHPQYRLFWTGNFISNTGTWMYTLAQGWLVLQLTNSPFWLGLVGFTSWIPLLLFTPLGGVIADRADRRRVMLLAQSALMVLAFLLALLTSLDIVNIRHILVLSFLSGLAMAMNTPAYQATLPDLVGAEDLSNAIALNSAQYNLSRMLGPALAGLALDRIGVAGCFYLNAFSFLALLLALARIRLPARAAADAGSSGRLWKPLLATFSYLRHHRVLRTLILLEALASFCGMSYIVLMPVFARDVLEVGPRGFGYLMGAAGVGALSGALLLAWRGDRPRKGAFALHSALLFYATLVVFALSRRFDLALVALALNGATMVTAFSTINNLLQKYVAPEMRGRIMATHAMAFLGMAPLGGLLAGAVAEHIGAPEALASLCLVALAITAVVRLRMRELHDLA